VVDALAPHPHARSPLIPEDPVSLGKMLRNRPAVQRDLPWRENIAAWLLLLVVVLFAVGLALLFTFGRQTAKINCAPGYHLQSGSCVRAT